MRLHLFDPQLGAADGHYLGYDSAIVGEFERRGIGAAVYGSVQARAQLTAAFPVEPVFSREIFTEVSADPQIWPLENYAQLNDEVAAELAGLDTSRFEAGDLAFFPTILQNQIDGVRRWVTSLPLKRQPALAIRISVLSHLMPYMQGRQNLVLTAMFLRQAARRLAAEYPRTVFCADTEELVELTRQIIDLPVALIPLPLTIERESRAAAPGARLCCAYLGHASPLKGVDLMPGLIAAFRNAADAPRFVVQLYPNDASTEPLDQALSALPADRTTIIRGPVEREAYLRLLDEADIVLLPYSAQLYGWASSGILVEALSLGKVVVAPEDTWLSRQAQRYNAGCQTFRDHTPAGLAAALRQAIADYPALARKAAEAAPSWRAGHSPARFVDVLLAAAT